MPRRLVAVHRYRPRSSSDVAENTTEEDIFPSMKPSMMMLRVKEELMGMKVSVLSLDQVMEGTGRADTWQVRRADWPGCVYRTTGKLKLVLTYL